MIKKDENEKKLNNIAAIRQKFLNLEKNVNVEQVKPKEDRKVGKLNINRQSLQKETNTNQPPVKQEKRVGKLNTDWLTKGSDVKSPPKKAPTVRRLDPSKLEIVSKMMQPPKKEMLQVDKLDLNKQEFVSKLMQPPKKEMLQVDKLDLNKQKNLNLFPPLNKEQPKIGKLHNEALGGELNLFGDVDVNQLNKEQLEEIVDVNLKTNYSLCCILKMDATEIYEKLAKTGSVSPEELFKAVQQYIETLGDYQEMAVMAFTASEVGFILMQGNYQGENQERLCYIDWNNFICQEIKSDKVPHHSKEHEALKNKCKEYAEFTNLPGLTSNQEDVHNVNAVVTEYLESAVAPAQEKLEELKKNELK